MSDERISTILANGEEVYLGPDDYDKIELDDSVINAFAMAILPLMRVHFTEESMTEE